jgi:hypothetical protein
VHPRESDLVLATHGRGIWIIDDISPLRSLTPDLMAKEAALIPGRPIIQYFNAFGGWSDGNETFSGRPRPAAAQITYYQKSRHIFGDLKIEILGPDGKVIDTIPGSTHRGLNRVSWFMRLKAPEVAPAATALNGAQLGPRVLPGTYTVRLTKGDQTYTEQISVVMDPRASYSLDDRRAEFDLSMKIYNLLEHMTWGVEALEGVRNAANARAATLPDKDPLRQQLEQLAGSCDELRSKIVATKEGGMITGEERIRELIGELYGNVSRYDGRPTDYQVARTESLGHELQDVIDDFQKLTQKDLSGINSSLKKKKMETIVVMSETDWQKKKTASGEGAEAAAMQESDVSHGEID